MFTGLIADLGTVTALEAGAAGATLTIETSLAGELAEGDSIRSSLGALEPGAEVNLELALRAGDRLGGHVVQGHVDGTGVISGTHEEGFSRVLELEIEPELARYLVEKGSVAIDGVSLTVSALREDGFAVSLIPETLKRTNLGKAQVRTPVNIEVDILAKHVERLLGARA
jgi:riboflavin synthase